MRKQYEVDFPGEGVRLVYFPASASSGLLSINNEKSRTGRTADSTLETKIRNL